MEKLPPKQKINRNATREELLKLDKNVKNIKNVKFLCM